MTKIRNVDYPGYLKPCFTEEENLSTDFHTKILSQGGTVGGIKPTLIKTPCNSSDDVLAKKEGCDSLPRGTSSALGSRTQSKHHLKAGTLNIRAPRTASGSKKAKAKNNIQSSRSAESNEVRRKNPVLKKIIDSLKDKIADGDVEEKIYTYLDFIDRNGAPSTFFVSRSQAELSKTKKSKKAKHPSERTKAKETPLEDSSRRLVIDKKMAEFKDQLSRFTLAFKEQQIENEKLKKFIVHIVRDNQEGSITTPFL